jgi:predicted benzoate:H+ symporter BenE
LIMHLRVHLRWIVIVAPPSDIAISLVRGAGVPGNGPAALGIIEAVVARFSTAAQQSLAMPLDIILDLSAGHGEGIGVGRG